MQALDQGRDERSEKPSNTIEESTVDWYRAESKRLTPITGEPGSQVEKRLIERWKVQSPKAYLRLRAGILAEAAHVLMEKALEAENQYLKAGMYSTDAREQAETEWLYLGGD